MMWQPLSDDETSPQTQRVCLADAASPLGGRPLPGWESFPLQDRRQLIHLLIQTARRQVQRRPTVRRGEERG
jgi:hypothetical protein